MFRWGLNSETAFVFARIQSAGGATQICYCGDGSTIEVRTPVSGQYFYPSLYERTDGVRWLAFEHNGQIMHQAWDSGTPEEHAVAGGSEPRWSADGKRLVMSRRRGDGPSAAYDVAVRSLKDQTDTVASVASGIVRSPVWSPDEQAVAFYVRGPREGDPWQIQVSRLDQEPTPTTVIADVVVNPDYKSEGPSWEPSGSRLWCFSHQHRQQEHYPFVAAEISSHRATLVDYPQRCTNPNDLALNPRTEIPEIAFVGRDGATQDVFVVLLNHF
jgi:Tol biopolymer transport system component